MASDLCGWRGLPNEKASFPAVSLSRISTDCFPDLLAEGPRFAWTEPTLFLPVRPIAHGRPCLILPLACLCKLCHSFFIYCHSWNYTFLKGTSEHACLSLTLCSLPTSLTLWHAFRVANGISCRKFKMRHFVPPWFLRGNLPYVVSAVACGDPSPGSLCWSPWCLFCCGVRAQGRVLRHWWLLRAPARAGRVTKHENKQLPSCHQPADCVPVEYYCQSGILSLVWEHAVQYNPTAEGMLLLKLRHICTENTLTILTQAEGAINTRGPRQSH